MKKITGSSYGRTVSLAPDNLRRDPVESLLKRIEDVFERTVSDHIDDALYLHPFDKQARRRYLEQQIAQDVIFQEAEVAAEVLRLSREKAHSPTKNKNIGGLSAFLKKTGPAWYLARSTEFVRSLPDDSPFDGPDFLGVFSRYKSAFSWVLGKISRLAEEVDGAQNLILWAHTLVLSERGVLKRLEDSYDPKQNLRHFVHLMLDTEYGYDEAPQYELPEQIRHMSKLASGGQGRLIGFVAFDPRRSDCLTLIKNARMNYGFKGVKFYPGLEYYPWKPGHPHHAKVVELYKYCTAGEGFPILTHSSPGGLGPNRKNTWKFNNPEGWRGALDKFRTLRLCLGHAGGGQRDKTKFGGGWYAPNYASDWKAGDNFARIAVELAQTYPNVYCGISGLDHVMDLDPKLRKYFATNFVREWESNTGKYKFRDKAIYGSDWHTQDMIDRTTEYLNHFIKLFEKAEEPMKGQRDLFFYDNARHFLGR